MSRPSASSPAKSASTTDRWRAAARAVAGCPGYVHRGRDPRTGLDCIGLVLAMYRAAGESIDELDVPYGERDATRASRRELLLRVLARRFDPVRATGPGDCRDGDVLDVRRRAPGEPEIHLGVVVGGEMVDLASARVRRSRLVAAWPYVGAVYRLRRDPGPVVLVEQ